MKKQLEQERQDLSKALKVGSISTNEYSSFYYALSQRINKIA